MHGRHAITAAAEQMSAVGLLNVLLLVDSYARAAAFCVVFSNLICEVSTCQSAVGFFWYM